MNFRLEDFGILCDKRFYQLIVLRIDLNMFNSFIIKNVFSRKRSSNAANIKLLADLRGVYIQSLICCDVDSVVPSAYRRCAPRKVGSATEALCPRLQGHSRSKRDFLRKRSDDGAAKIPPKYGRDDCREAHRDVVRSTGLEPVRLSHTPLKRARLPIPPRPHRCDDGYYIC